MQSSHTLTPASLSWRKRASEAALRKICETYHISTGLPDNIAAIINPVIETTLHTTDKWLNTRDDAIARSPNPDTISIPAVEQAARSIVQSYVEAFYVREQTLKAPDPKAEFYRKDSAKKQLIDIYINHRCNHAELALQSLGLSAASAHAINGALIRVSMITYRAYNENKEISCINPGIGSVRGTPQLGSIPATQRPIPERIDELRGYWRLKAFEVNHDHQRFRSVPNR
jgi:hypothetical protein